MSSSPLQIERRDSLAVLTLARPERRNALSRELLAALGDAGQRLLADRSLRAVVLTGAGERAFCAGADLIERAQMTEPEIREQLQRYRTELSWLRDPRLVTVAALNGVALGGGLELSLWCDFRIAHESALVGLVETTVGVIPGAGGTQLLPRLLGEARAKELILLARKLSASEALALGLVHAVVAGPADETAERAREWLAPLLNASAPLATRAALAAIQAAAELPLAAGLERELAEYERCLTSEDRLEALAAFRDKRSPAFKGR